MLAASQTKAKVIQEVSLRQRATLRVPDWAIKTSFSSDEERERFIASVQEGYTPLHVAECEEARGIYEIVDGVHRFEALEVLGEKSIPCYDHGRLSLIERKALAVRYAWNFSRDHNAFAHVLKDLQELDATLLNWSPVEQTELTRLIAELNDDLPLFDDEEEYMPKPTPPKAEVNKSRALKTVTCPHCSREFNL